MEQSKVIDTFETYQDTPFPTWEAELEWRKTHPPRKNKEGVLPSLCGPLLSPPTYIY